MKQGYFVAVVAVRKGSQRIPNKNITPFGDSNLLEWKIHQALQIKGINKIIVSSPSKSIAKIVGKYNITFHLRKKTTSIDKLHLDLSKKFNGGVIMDMGPYVSSIKRIFDDISEKRGLFFEFPQNTINLDNKNYFFDNENDNDFDQYKYDYLESLIISRSGINNWSISYKDQISFFENIDDVTERIRFLFENLSIDYLSDFVLDNSERKLLMTVTKVSSAEHLDNLLEALDKMISIKEYSIKSFQQKEISFSLTIFGTEDQFKKFVQTHKDFSIERTETGLIHASLNSI